MSKMFSNSITDFLDENGTPLARLSVKKKKLLRNLVYIIHSVNKKQDYNELMCWNILNGKKCQGRIDASIALEFYEIIWHCLKCGNNGVIKKWKKVDLNKCNSV